MTEQIIDRVTMTGADDSINPRALIELSAEFPFVEWGILFSQSSIGTPRYPSREWIEDYSNVAGDNDFQSSAHLCGKWVRDIVLNANFSWTEEYRYNLAQFRRIQLNFHAAQHPPCAEFYTLLDQYPGKSFILQMDGVNESILLAGRERGVMNVYPLFDLSGGAGIVPDKWEAAFPGMYCGYAGGLGPQNLGDNLPLIVAAAKQNPDAEDRIWIDMETHIRSQDDFQFDLEKVRACLELVKPWVKA